MADPRRVQTPDGVVHEFPPDATDAEISAALNSVAPKPQTPAEQIQAVPSAGADKAIRTLVIPNLPFIGGPLASPQAV